MSKSSLIDARITAYRKNKKIESYFELQDLENEGSNSLKIFEL